MEWVPSPFNDAVTGFLIQEDITEWILGNHYYGVGLEVVAELPGCDQDSIQQLLDLRIASLRLVQDFTDEIHWVLDFIGMSDLFLFDDDCCADHPVSHRDVD